MISRRELLLGLGAAPFVIKSLRAQRSPLRPKLAAICTTYFKYSHAQHIVDRFLKGYGWNGTHHRPEMDLLKGGGVHSTQFLMSPEPNVTYSECLVRKIEELFETGKAPCPVERTLLAGGVLESCLTSRLEGQKTLLTPHLDVRYRAPLQSQHART